MKTLHTILTILICLSCYFPVKSQSRPLDTSLPVGTMAGAFNVSNSGDATYQIPIIVPPGTGGMAPNISINYNSAVGNGIMGFGWALGATSAITRVPSNFYHEGLTDGVDFDNYDRFALDGNRLILISGTYGAAGSVYYTESETFVKVTAMGSTTNGPQWFEVKTKDGRTLEYGNTTLSRFEGAGRTDVIIWYLNKVTDANGNYMTYTYHNDKTNGEYWLEKIDYTGNATTSLATYNSVVFTYQTRNDIRTDYIYGAPFKTSKYLSDIKTLCEGVQVKKYVFNYTYDTYLHLSEIVEYGTDGTTKYNSTLVNWYPQEYSGQTYFTSLPVSGTPFFDDFNGDGKSEIIYSTGILYSLNSTGTDFVTTGSSGLPASSTFRTGDFNGDGRADALKSLSNSSNSFSYYKSGGTSFTSVGSYGPSVTTMAELYPNDFNGDGITDVLVRNPVSGTLYVYWGNASSPFSSNTAITCNWGTKQFFYDFNGDGKTDIMTVDGAGYKIYEWDVSSFVLKLSNATPTSSQEFFFGDYNGDGLTDFIYASNMPPFMGDGFWKIYSGISTGNGFITDSFGYEISGSLADLSVYDADGDGKDELHQFYYMNLLIESYQYVFNNFTWSKLFGGDITGVPFYTNDYNGDGMIDFLCTFSSGDNEKVLEYHATGHLRHMVSSISNGFNNTISINYKPLTDASVYTRYSSGSYPVIDYQNSGVVVSSVLFDNGLGGQDKIDYKYEGAKFDNRTKNFIGFLKVTRIDNTQGLQNINDYAINSTYNIQVPLKSQVQNTSGVIFSETTLTVATKNFGNKRFWPYVSGKQSIDHLHGDVVTNSITDTIITEI